MNSKRNQILLGIIILIIGLAALFLPRGARIFNMGSLVFISVGMALLLLYKTKKRSWALIFGGYLTFTGVAWLLSPIIGHRAVLNIIGAMFFLIPSIAFFILYFDKNKKKFLVPASMMFWFGVFLCLKDIPVFLRISTFGMLLVFMGAAFLTIYLIGKASSKRTLYVGCGIFAIGLIRVISSTLFALAFGGVGRLLAISLVIISAVIIVRAVKK